MNTSFNLNQAFENVNSGADWFGIREVNESTAIHLVRDKNPEANYISTSHGIMAEVFANGHFGYSSTNELSQEGIQEAIDRAENNAATCSTHSLKSFDTSVRPTSKGIYNRINENQANDISIPELNGHLKKGCEFLKVSDKIICTTGFARIVKSKQRYLNSDGGDLEQDFHFISLDFTATAQLDGILQKRTDHGMLSRSYQAGSESVLELDIESRCKKIGEQAHELLYADECPFGNLPLVLAPDQMMLQIHESIGHPLEIDRILGDERNYAGWSFVKLSDFGKLKYGSDKMNVTFDPTIPEQFASYGYDDHGLKAEKEFIIKDGLLLRGLGGSESQYRTQMEGVANSRACSWNRPPIDRMANLNLEPGESSFDDIISGIEYGVFMESNRSWSIDDYRNKFQFGCEYGKLIENGKLTKTLRNPNYRGITTPFWNNLAKVGDQSTYKVYGVPFCGKGEPNQTIRVGHASPVCLFNDVEIFGGI